MDTVVIKHIQDMTFLDWSHIRSSSGTAGTLLKAETIENGRKVYYKLSGYDSVEGITGHECLNEIIIDRLLTILGIEHLHYQLTHAKVEIDGRNHITWLCASEDFKQQGESKIALDDFYRVNALKGESHYDFCCRMGWREYVDRMIAVDYLILNRDRHGANIEVLRNSRSKTMRIAPLFDHGLSLLFSCQTDEEIQKFDVMKDRPCQNYIGSRSCLENLKYITDKASVFPCKLEEEDKKILFQDLEDVISEAHRKAIWSMIYRRYLHYENL